MTEEGAIDHLIGRVLPDDWVRHLKALNLPEDLYRTDKRKALSTCFGEEVVNNGEIVWGASEDIQVSVTRHTIKK